MPASGMTAMAEPVRLQDFVARVQARKAALGLTEADFAAARNSGLRRTEGKRAQLRAMAERAKAAGLTPYPAKY